jgi:hypothetical protein
MSEQEFPIPCKSSSCGKPLYGPVKYCPYCGELIGSSAIDDLSVEEEVTGPQTNESPIVSGPERRPVASVPKSVHVAEQKPAPETEAILPVSVGVPVEQPEKAVSLATHRRKLEHVEEIKSPLQPLPDKTTQRSTTGKMKWIGIFLVLGVAIGGYLLFQHKGGGAVGTPDSFDMPGANTPYQGKRETARVLALETLRQGTDLSVTISTLPKLEKVLEAAKKLGEISPRYQEQVTTAEITLKSSRKNRDKILMAYLGKSLELGRYTQEQISYALGVIQNGDLTSREKIVTELLAGHVKSINNKGKADPERVLSDFNQHFSDFVD